MKSRRQVLSRLLGQRTVPGRGTRRGGLAPETDLPPSSADPASGAESAFPGGRLSDRAYAARPAMGSLFEIFLCGEDPEHLEGAANEALEEVQRLERQLSHYRDDSDVARLNAMADAEWVRVEPGLYSLLERCAVLSQATEGAFDITTGPLVKAWGFYRGEGRVPPEEEVAAILQRTGMARVRLDPGGSAVRFDAAGLEVTLGAVGKGYALDEAAGILRFYGVESAVLHGGRSTIYALGAPPGADGWEFTLRDPRDRTTPLRTVSLRDRAVSTSGDYEQFFEVDGTRYSHILDPRSGRPVAGMRCVWVIAPSATDSDALSTAFFVLGPEKTAEFCRRYPELEVVMVQDAPGGEGIRVTQIAPGGASGETFACISDSSPTA